MTPTIEALSRLTTLTLLHFVWQGAALGFAAWVLTAALHRRKDARLWHGTMVAVLIGMVACPMVTALLLTPAPTPPPAQTPVLQRIEFNVPLTVVDQTRGLSPAPDATTTDLRIDPNSATLTLRPLDEPDSAFSAPAPKRLSFDPAPLAPYVSAAYLLGLALMLVRLGTGVYGGQRLRRTSEPIVAPELLESLRAKAQALGLRIVPPLAYCARVSVPTVVGVVRPMILLPVHLQTGLSVAHLELLLLHELAHIRRYDHVINLLQRVAETLLFFHPAVWYVSRQIAVAREHCCDDLVIRAGGERTDYARLLVESGERASAPSLAALSAVDKPSRLRRRIARILETDLPVKLGRAGVWAVALLMVLGVAAIGVIAAKRKEAESLETTPVVATDATADMNPEQVAPAQRQPGELSRNPIHDAAAPADLPDELIRELVQSNDPWLRKVAALRAGDSGNKEYVPYLIKVLSTGDEAPIVREAAATALGQIGDPSAVPYLVAALRSEKLTRDAAAQALAQISDPLVMEFLEIARRDSDPSVRGSAYFALSVIGTDDAITQLIQVGLRDTEPGVRLAVISLLAASNAQDEITSRLEAALKDPNTRISQGALLAMCRSESPEAQKLYLNALELRSIVPQGESLQLLIEQHKNDEQVVAVLGNLLLSGELNAVTSAGRQGVAQAMIDLGLVPDDPAEQCRVHVLAGNYGVATRYSALALEPLVEALEIERETHIKGYIIEALGQLRDERAVPYIAKYLGIGPPYEASSAAFDALQQIGGELAAEALAGGLVSREWDARQASARRLGQMKAETAVEPLMRSLKDAHPEVRGASAWALGEIGDDRAVPALIEALKDFNPAVVNPVIDALAQIGDKDAVPALIERLDDSVGDVRIVAARALGSFGDPRAIEPLVAAYDMTQITFDPGGGSRWGGHLNDVIRAALDKLGADGHALARERFERESKRSAAEPQSGGAASSAAPREFKVVADAVRAVGVALLIDGDDQLYVDLKPVTISDLEVELARGAQQRPGYPIMVIQHENATDEIVNSVSIVLDEIERDKFWISLSREAPTVAEKQRDEREQRNTVPFAVLDGQGNVVFEGSFEEFETSDVRETLESLASARPDLSLIVRPSAPVDLTPEARIMDVARSVGFQSVSLVSQPESSASAIEEGRLELMRWPGMPDALVSIPSAVQASHVHGVVEAVIGAVDAVLARDATAIERHTDEPVSEDPNFEEELEEFARAWEDFERDGGRLREIEQLVLYADRALALSSARAGANRRIMFDLAFSSGRWIMATDPKFVSEQEFREYVEQFGAGLGGVTPVEVSIDWTTE